MIWTKVVDVLGKQWTMPVQHAGGRVHSGSTSSGGNIHFNIFHDCKKKKERQIHSKHLIQGELYICRQYGQFKGINMNEFSSMTSSFFIMTKNDPKGGDIWILHSHSKTVSSNNHGVITLVMIGLKTPKND